MPTDICTIVGRLWARRSVNSMDTTSRVRISCDLRWQGKPMPKDERYFGPNPGGTTDAGYRELNGAKPLDQPAHPVELTGPPRFLASSPLRTMLVQLHAATAGS